MMLAMRTTITLDDDVAAKLREAARDHGISFKEALNANVRRGLASEEAKPRPYRLPTSEAILERPLPIEEALDYVDAWLAQPVSTVGRPPGGAGNRTWGRALLP